MITRAVEDQHILHAGQICALHGRHGDALMIQRSRILAGSRIAQHSASVQALPPDDPGAGRIMRAVKQVKLDTGFARNLRHRHRMAEDVRLPGEADVVAEFLLAEFLSVEELPHHGFAVADVFVHLHPA